jgi:hypothetical protein
MSSTYSLPYPKFKSPITPTDYNSVLQSGLDKLNTPSKSLCRQVLLLNTVDRLVEETAKSSTQYYHWRRKLSEKLFRVNCSTSLDVALNQLNNVGNKVKIDELSQLLGGLKIDSNSNWKKEDFQSDKMLRKLMHKTIGKPFKAKLKR